MNDIVRLTDKNTFLLDIPSLTFEIPAWLQKKAQAAEYDNKSEYHVTIIGKKIAAKIGELQAVSAIQALAKQYEWDMQGTDTYIELAQTDESGLHRQSIIQLVSVPAFEPFFDEVEKILLQPIDRPPAHITLFTKNYDRGIGVYSQEDLTRFTVRHLSSY